MRGRGNIIWAAVAWLTVVVGLSACENVIEPLTEDAERVFAVHGFLDMAADTQFVRVSALRPTVLDEERVLENVKVTSVNQNSLDAVDWIDSTIVLDDGTAGHLFYGVFRPESNVSYELKIIKDGSIAAKATTTIPDRPPYFASVPTGDTLQFSQVVVIQGLSSVPYDVSVEYDVSRPEAAQSEKITIPYPPDDTNVLGGWELEVFLKRDQFTALSQLDWPASGPPLELRSVRASVAILGTEWGETDAPKNLENAHGFFSSIGRFDLPWTLERSDVEKMGFVDKQTPF